jgi:hypothetical protein
MRSKSRLSYVYTAAPRPGQTRRGHFPKTLEATVKRTHLSPAASLVVSLSLVVGILVCDIAGSRLLTAAHAQSGCSGQGSSVNINEGVLTGGVVVRNVVVGGQLVALAYVPGSVQVVRGTIVSDGSTDGIIVSDGVSAQGIIVSDGSTCTNGIIVSDGSPSGGTQGIIVSDGLSVAGDGIIVSDGGGTAATGGTLSGDGIIVSDGIVTGANLRLTDATIVGGSMRFNGVLKKVRVAPAN